MTETWLPIAGFEGSYEVSDHGRVRSLDRTVKCSGPSKGTYLSRKPGRMLRPGTMSGGHVSVMLGREGGSRTVHSLVAEAFIGPCPPGCEVRHLDGNPTNNVAGNLAYGTRSENNRDKKWHRGQANFKLNPKQVGEIKRALARGAKDASLAPRYNVSPHAIYCIRIGRTHVDVPAFY